DGDQLAVANDDLVGDGVDDVGAADAATDGVGEAHFDLFAAVHHAAGNPLRRAAVFHGDDHVLGDVGEFAGEVARVGGFEGRIGEALANPVRRAEVFEHRQAFAEISLNGGFDDFAVGLGHQTAHPGELADLLDTAAGARVGHQKHRVHVGPVLADIVVELVHHGDRDLLANVRPGFEHLVIPLAVGDDALLEESLLLQHGRFGRPDDFLFVGRSLQVAGAERQTAAGRERKADF